MVKLTAELPMANLLPALALALGALTAFPAFALAALPDLEGL